MIKWGKGRQLIKWEKRKKAMVFQREDEKEGEDKESFGRIC